MPRVSIALPVYNGQNFVSEAIDSLLTQTFTDFELYLVDNASTDRTTEICRSYAARDARVRHHLNPTNIGGGPNFNLGFRLASAAPYFKWAAHDDRHRPEFLAECVAALDANPEVVLAFPDVETIDGQGRVVAAYDPDLPEIGDPRPSVRFRNLILSDHHCYDQFGVIRREALAQTHLQGGYVGSDRMMLAKLGLLGRFHRVRRPLFQIRDHDDRSVRAIDTRERGFWFNPKLKGKILLPYWRYFLEYNRALLGVPLPTKERLACLNAMGEWLMINRHRMRKDLTMGYAKLRKMMGLAEPVGGPNAVQ